VAKAREERAEITDPTLVLEAALRFLEARQRSSDEVRRRLLLHGYRFDLVDKAVARLTELGILDDEAFAKAWVESRDRAHPRGERALRVELRQKGIDRETLEGVIEQREQERPEANAEAATRLLMRQLRSLERVTDPRARRQRAYALLARNGFDSETAVQAINAILAPAEE
jgi:regulatory protein